MCPCQWVVAVMVAECSLWYDFFNLYFCLPYDRERSAAGEVGRKGYQLGCRSFEVVLPWTQRSIVSILHVWWSHGLQQQLQLQQSVVVFRLCVCCVWYSGRTLVFDWQTFPVMRSTCSWQVTTYVDKSSAIGQPTGPTQPFILLGVDKWVIGYN